MLRTTLFLGACAGSFYAGMINSRIGKCTINGAPVTNPTVTRVWNPSLSPLTEDLDFARFFEQLYTYDLELKVEERSSENFD